MPGVSIHEHIRGLYAQSVRAHLDGDTREGDRLAAEARDLEAFLASLQVGLGLSLLASVGDAT